VDDSSSSNDTEEEVKDDEPPVLMDNKVEMKPKPDKLVDFVPFIPQSHKI
jgi:hypothetical protein